MSKTKDYWFAEYERAEDEFACGKIGEAEFREEMARLGFDRDEIDEHPLVSNANVLP